MPKLEDGFVKLEAARDVLIEQGSELTKSSVTRGASSGSIGTTESDMDVAVTNFGKALCEVCLEKIMEDPSIGGHERKAVDSSTRRLVGIMFSIKKSVGTDDMMMLQSIIDHPGTYICENGLLSEFSNPNNPYKQAFIVQDFLIGSGQIEVSPSELQRLEILGACCAATTKCIDAMKGEFNFAKFQEMLHLEKPELMAKTPAGVSALQELLAATQALAEFDKVQRSTSRGYIAPKATLDELSERAKEITSSTATSKRGHTL